MIFYDVTKAGRGGPRSGLMRTSERVRIALGAAVTPVRWGEWDPRVMGESDWFLTAELFAPDERVGMNAFLAAQGARTAALYHDAIPMKLPHVTWPQSVARHPHYLKMLGQFGRVLANSEASRGELEHYWRWLGRENAPAVTALTLGADFDGQPRQAGPEPEERVSLLCVGIIEPRKNQLLLLEACERVWREGLDFRLHVAGRMNPHFGRATVAAIKAARRRGRAVVWHEAPDDAALRKLYRGASVAVFPTQAEGCGLPVVEALWQGVPCVCSDLPVLREHERGGGCVYVRSGEVDAWAEAVRAVVGQAELRRQLRAAAATRPLPTWADTARQVRAALGC
ncbi:glycosyltransferase [Horticoccus luteus]|uniref:Glycosyltransferase n=1 Tax=Horticoccus luteus TaxID=2862869 RepID=A0A8F9TT16_9BACT|nr:glycosyltransferase [Horticoccus luteus]QYM77562.1 glycosyltransferase [Horticoccus luteus]